MRYELTDHEMGPHQAHAAERATWRNTGERPPCSRRHLLGVAIRGAFARPAGWFWSLATRYNRFVRRRRADVWSKIMSALAGAHDATLQMIDTSIIRVHQHGACISWNRRQSMGRSRGGLTSKIHAVVDTNGLPVQLALTAGEAHDNRLAGSVLSRLKAGSMLLADRGYDADWIRALVTNRCAERGL
jgi:transposase